MMMRTYLEKLKQKPIPNQNCKKGVYVHFDNIESKEVRAERKDSEGEPERKDSEGEPERKDSEEDHSDKIVPILFQDDRKTTKLDRATVLDSLKTNNVFSVRRAVDPRQMSVLEEEEQDELVDTIEPPLKEVVDSLILSKDNEEIDDTAEVVEKEKRVKKDEKDEKVVKKPKTKRIIKKREDALLEEVEKRSAIPKMGHILQSSPYYMNNRKLFIQKLGPMFAQYKKELSDSTKKASCDDSGSQSNVEFKLMVHQKVVADYLNLYTPYRGLLLYHGLGSGKTCTSIAIAEGMKSVKHIFVMTLASLKANFFEQMKVCGDPIYKLNQRWKFVSSEGQSDIIPKLAQALSISTKTVRKNRGVWMVASEDVPDYVNQDNTDHPPSDFANLNDSDKKRVNEQLDEMIRAKYTDLNYNAPNLSDKIAALPTSGSKNPFDNSVVIIDEAHNFVSRIVNKSTGAQKKSISYRLYEMLMGATNARIVLLSGTPIINYPNEIGIMFNILRGYIKTWTFPVTRLEGVGDTSRENLLKWFAQDGLNRYDYVDFSGDKLTVTRNPFGFENVFKKGRENMKRGGGKRKQGTASKKTSNPRKTAKKSKTGIFEIKKGLLVLRDPLEGSTLDETDEMRQERIHAQREVQMGGGLYEEYAGVELDETGNMSDAEFKKRIIQMLAKHHLKTQSAKVKMVQNTALPSVSKEFMEMFVELGAKTMKNKDVFQRRILGLTSYFKGADESLYPEYVLANDDGDDEHAKDNIYHIERVPMSDYQFGLYEAIRDVESKREKQNQKNKAKREKQGGREELFKIASTYRIASRMCCNFAFPNPPGRPQKRKGENGGDDDVNEFEEEEEEEEDMDLVDNLSSKKIGGSLDDEEKEEDDEDEEKEDDDEDEEKDDEPKLKISDDHVDIQVQDLSEDIEIPEENEDSPDYSKRIQRALQELKSRSDEIFSVAGLQMYSPKFLKILENIQNKDNEGLHLIYSQFRSMEGVGILKLMLEANGFAELKLHRSGGEWDLDESEDDVGKPKFALHTGTESDEEKKIILNIYNSKWGEVPSKIISKFKERGQENNFMGEVVRILMITASGAEGINLKNTRFVHIVEPYWHQVRLEQVIGRARRICSHQDLPQELRTVQVFLYIATLSEEQSKNDKHAELRLRDTSKLTKKLSSDIDKSSLLGLYIRTLKDSPGVVTTDEQLFENALRKDYVNAQILNAVKETAMDCRLYNNQNKAENLVCYSFGQVSSNAFGSYPNITEDLNEASVKGTRATKTKFVTLPYRGVKYAKDTRTGYLYEIDTFMEAKETGVDIGEPVGRVVKKNGKEEVELS